MSKFTLLFAALLAATGCERDETIAERTAAAHKVCREAGLNAKEGESMMGTLVIYCAAPSVESAQ